jgi:AsmA protein
MRKILILGAVLLILAGALFVAASNLNRYLAENREWLAERASSALGRSVAFDEIGVSLRGGLGARVTSVAIGEDPAFGKGEFLRADRIDAVIKILPALRGRYEVARLEIDAPEINVIKTRSGFNFDSLGRAAGDQAPAAEPDTPAGALPFLVSSLRISDGRLQFIDRSASPASELSVDHLDFSASDVGLDQPIQLDLAAAVLGVAEQNVRVEGTFGPLGSSEAAASAPVDLRVDLGPLVIDRLKKLALIGESIPAELSSPDPIVLSVKLSGNLDTLGTIVSMDASGAAISYGDQFAKPKGVRFAVDADVKRVGDAIDVAKLDLHLAKAHLTGSGRIGLTPEMPVDFKLSGRDVPLDDWGRLIPAAAAVEAAGALDLELTAKGPAGGGRIPRLDGTLGLRGVSVNQGGGDTRIDDLTTTVTLKGDRAEIPPTDFKLNGSPVRIAATVEHQASRRGQKFTFERLELSAFDGSIDGTGSYDMAKADEPAFSFRGKVDGIDVGALVAHFGAGRALQMSGRLQGTFDLDGRGSEWEVIRRALVGNGALEVADGVLKGVNIAESVLGGLTGIPGLSNLISPKVRSKYPELFGMDDTVFEVLAGKMTLRDGQALFDEIALAARDYRLDGKGTIGLDKALDIGMTFVASQNLTGDLIRSAKEIQYLTDANGRFNLPLRLAGSMPTIRAQPDVQYAARQLSSSLLQTGLSKGLDALIGKKRAPEPAPEGDAEPVANTPAEQSPPQSDPAEQSTAQPDPTEQPAAQPDPAEELIRRGLGALLGGDQE